MFSGTHIFNSGTLLCCLIGAVGFSLPQCSQAAAAPHASTSSHPTSAHPVQKLAEKTADHTGDRSALTSPLTVQPVEDGYNVAGPAFSLHLTRTGMLTDINSHGRPIFDRAYVEVRDKTWHVKLSPKPEAVRSAPPVPERDGERFEYTGQIGDPATGIQIAFTERVLIHANSSIDVTLKFTPQVPFEARRISWNVEFAADRYVDTACAWQSGKDPQNTLQFPKQQAPDPRLAHNFEWIRLNCGDGPVDLRFTSQGADHKTMDVNNVLEDLRLWKQPTFWIADAAPYAAPGGEGDKPLEISAGDTRTLRISICLHCAGGG